MEKLVLVGAGGFFGAISRYLVADWAAARLGSGFPYGTLFVNVAGSFLLALFLGLALERLLIAPPWRLFFAIGFLGSFTTFSTFAFETDMLFRDAQWHLAFLNVAANLLVSYLAVRLGVMLSRAF